MGLFRLVFPPLYAPDIAANRGNFGAKAMQELPDFLTVKQFLEKHTAFTHGGLRSAIYWQGEALEKAGAIARLGRRVLINESVFLRFVQAGGLRNVRGDV